MNQHQKNVRLTASGVMIALATALSMVTLFKMPQGGDVTPCSLLPICMISIIYGVKWGMGTAFAYSLVRLTLHFSEALSWGLSVRALVICFVLDYFIAYTALGLSGIFRNQGSWGIFAGIAVAFVLKFISHVISGVAVFAVWMPDNFSNIWVYSLVYNLSHVLPEMIITIAGAYLLCKVPALKKLKTT